METYIFYMHFLLVNPNGTMEDINVPIEEKAGNYEMARARVLEKAQSVVRAYEEDEVTAFFRIEHNL